MKKIKTYRPYTWEERDQLRGKWAKFIHGFKEEFLIHNIYVNSDGELIINDLPAERFLEICIWLDGTPCGVLVEGEEETADAINQAMSNYATAVDPCGMCRHREHTNVTEICGQCCYYWGSKFEFDRETGEEEGGKT